MGRRLEWPQACTGGTHKETPRLAVLAMDGAAGVSTETQVCFGMVDVKVIPLKICKLVLGEAQFPRNLAPADGESVVVFWDEGHGVMVK